MYFSSHGVNWGIILLMALLMVFFPRGRMALLNPWGGSGPP